MPKLLYYLLELFPNNKSGHKENFLAFSNSFSFRLSYQEPTINIHQGGFLRQNGLMERSCHRAQKVMLENWLMLESSAI